ncbi:hypothetical protein [Nocardioides humi]|uniref:Uncharacterized protein n=1 Tax=Nocardioides humi TaxID=449461 RepID=A0ABN2B1G7_9ACTN|nr:hypothetical protein [Nocardioides humi]
MIGQRGGRGIELDRPGRGGLVSEDLRRQDGSAAPQGGGVVIEGLQDPEAPAAIQRLTFGQQLGTAGRVSGGGVQHANVTGRIVGRLCQGMLQQLADRQHLALESTPEWTLGWALRHHNNLLAVVCVWWCRIDTTEASPERAGLRAGADVRGDVWGRAQTEMP